MDGSRIPFSRLCRMHNQDYFSTLFLSKATRRYLALYQRKSNTPVTREFVFFGGPHNSPQQGQWIFGTITLTFSLNQSLSRILSVNKLSMHLITNSLTFPRQIEGFSCRRVAFIVFLLQNITFPESVLLGQQNINEPRSWIKLSVPYKQYRLPKRCHLIQSIP